VIPTLYTPRLTLRAPTMADLDAMIAFYEATEVEVGGYAKRDAAGAKAVLEGFIESWERHGHGMWLLENAKGDVIGGAGLGLPDGFPHHELTWFLFPDAQGKGYASEASKAVIAWGYDEAGFDPVMTYMRDKNAPARALAARLGGNVIRRETFPDGVTRDVFALPYPGQPAQRMPDRLETERLTLSRPKPADLDAFTAFVATDRSIYVRKDAKASTAFRGFAHILGHWPIRGYGLYAITRKDDDACMGWVGPFFPEGWPEHEFGWHIWDAANEGKGYVREAAETMRAAAYQNLGWSTAVSYIHLDNARSIALAERLGAVLDESAATPDDDPCFVYRHPAPEAKQ